jgi:histidinol-phosphate aminotransferase
MHLSELVKPSVLTQPVYQPGRPIEAVAADYGLDPEQVLKLASNENPLGPSPRAVEAMRAAATQMHYYPDGGATALRERIARERGITPQQVILGNGSNEIFELAAHAFIRPGDRCVMSEHAFIVYKLVTLLFDGEVVEVPMRAMTHDLPAMGRAVDERTRCVFVASPNNPVGTANTAAELLAFARALPEDVIFCFDEAYAEYLDEPPDLRALIDEGRKVICTRTFSKVHGLAGLRLGYGYASPEMIALLQQVRQPFNANRMAQLAALAALDDQEWVLRARRENARGRRQLAEGLRALGLEVVEGQANFVLARVGEADAVFTRLQHEGVIVRPLGGYGLPEYLRISVGTEAANQRALRALEGVLAAAPIRAPAPQS